MRNRKIFALSVMVCFVSSLVVALPGARAQSQPVKLKAVTFLAKGNPTAASFGRMVDAFNEEFKGKVSIEWVGGPEVVPEFQIHESVRNGMIDMGVTSCSFYKAILPVSDAPMFSNKSHSEMLSSGAYQLLGDLHKKAGVIYWGEVAFGQPFYIYTKFPLKTPKELVGKKIRVFPGVLPFVKALNAAPVNMAMPEIYTAMERGVVDGFAMATIGFVQSFAWHEVTKYMINHRFYRGSVAVLVNPKRWDQIPKEVQNKIIDWKQKTYDLKEDQLYTAFNDAQTKLIWDKGVKPIEFSPEDARAYLKLAYDSAWDQLVQKSPDVGGKLKTMLVK